VKVLTICNPENRKLAQNASVVDQHRSDADPDPTLHLDHFDAKPDPDSNPNSIFKLSGKNSTLSLLLAEINTDLDLAK
jgi:hypothetical protein